jgi:hypothetical protein
MRGISNGVSIGSDNFFLTTGAIAKVLRKTEAEVLERADRARLPRLHIARRRVFSGDDLAALRQPAQAARRAVRRGRKAKAA